MDEALLDGPGTETADGDPCANADGPILMPVQRPVGGGGLVEQDDAHGRRMTADNIARQGTDGTR